MQKTYFIADIAANHDGDINRAIKLCQLAKDCGADAAKFQHFKAETIVSDKGFNDLGSQKSHQSTWNKSVFEVYNDASVPLDWTKKLKDFCDSIELDFFTTPYDIDYVDELDNFVSQYKIGSGDITWHKMLHKVASKGKPVIIASGASKLDEVIKAVNILSNYKIPICLMQCNTNYTFDPENFNYINLNVLKKYKELFPNIRLGLSDHTEGDVTVLGAVSLGATVVEKHFTDDNDRVGPDHKFSMNPTTWKAMVERTRLLESSLGNGIKKVEDNELETVVLQRRSIRAQKNLKSGDIITESDLIEVRPCPIDAVPPVLNLVGTTIKADINQGDYIKYEHIGSKS
jgi:N-acetylneuraminate synthase